MKFHHVGIACEDIGDEAGCYTKIGYEKEGSIFVDSTQGIRGIFLTNSSSSIELLEDLDGSDTIKPWLNKGIKMYHLAYKVEEIHKETALLRSEGAIIVVNPVASVAFGGKLISFLFLKNKQLIELIES